MSTTLHGMPDPIYMLDTKHFVHTLDLPRTAHSALLDFVWFSQLSVFFIKLWLLYT